MVSKDSAEATALGAAWAKQGAVVTVKPFDRITKNQAIDPCYGSTKIGTTMQ